MMRKGRSALTTFLPFNLPNFIVTIQGVKGYSHCGAGTHLWVGCPLIRYLSATWLNSYILLRKNYE